jgi:hypothetical protein
MVKLADPILLFYKTIPTADVTGITSTTL